MYFKQEGSRFHLTAFYLLSRLHTSTVASGVLFRSPSRFQNQHLSSDFENPVSLSRQRGGLRLKYVFHYRYSLSKLICWLPLDCQIASKFKVGVLYPSRPTEPRRKQSVVDLSQNACRTSTRPLLASPYNLTSDPET